MGCVCLCVCSVWVLALLSDSSLFVVSFLAASAFFVSVAALWFFFPDCLITEPTQPYWLHIIPQLLQADCVISQSGRVCLCAHILPISAGHERQHVCMYS